MNRQRRKVIEAVTGKLDELKEEIEGIACEEQEAYDNLPDSLQDSDQGGAISDNVSDLEQAASDIEDIISNLQDIIER